jgi:putative toxin-antitoxin system antitoxin component (TIGR02293 family)
MARERSLALALKPRAEAPDVESYWNAVKAGRGTSHQYVRLLGLKVAEPHQILKEVERGLAFKALQRFQENTQLSTNELVELVAITPRTFQRRKEEGRLDPDESDRLLRVSRVFAKALELFEGDADAARSWFHTEPQALAGKSPLALARTDLGSREVETLIDRLEHGVLN